MTKARFWLAAGLALAAPLSSAVSETVPPPVPDAEVRIPMVRFGAIRSFHPVSDDVVYLQGSNRRQWYRATLSGPCFNLTSALRVGIDTRFNGDTLDNSSSLLVDGQSCRISSLVRSGPPPRER